MTSLPLRARRRSAGAAGPLPADARIPWWERQSLTGALHRRRAVVGTGASKVRGSALALPLTGGPQSAQARRWRASSGPGARESSR